MARIATVKYDETHGLYQRALGMDANGRKPKFWLGPDKSVAERRVERLELLWSQVEQDWSTLSDEYPDWLESRLIAKPERPLWDELTLAAARRIAKGETPFPLPRKPSWSPYQYAMRLANIQRRFSAIQFVPDEREEEYHRIGTELVQADARSEIDAAHDTLAAVAGQAGQSLHQVFDAYIAYLSKLPAFPTSNYYEGSDSAQVSTADCWLTFQEQSPTFTMMDSAREFRRRLRHTTHPLFAAPDRKQDNSGGLLLPLCWYMNLTSLGGFRDMVLP